jgi:ornithine decarboxylase
MATAAVDRLSATTINYASNHVLLKTNHFSDRPPNHSNGVISPKQLIGDALLQRIESIDPELCQPGDEDTFFVADLGEVYRQHMRWKMNLPRVKPFYGKYNSCRLSSPNALQLFSFLSK